MKYENRSVEPFGRTGLDHADGCITVFHRVRKITRLEGRAHALPLRFRNPALKNEALGATADRAVKRADSKLFWLRFRQNLAPDLRYTRRRIPQRFAFNPGSVFNLQSQDFDRPCSLAPFSSAHIRPNSRCDAITQPFRSAAVQSPFPRSPSAHPNPIRSLIEA